MKVVAKIVLEREDLTQLREVLARETGIDCSKLLALTGPLRHLIEQFLNNAFSRGMDFRDHNMATHIDVEW